MLLNNKTIILFVKIELGDVVDIKYTKTVTKLFIHSNSI